MLPFLIRYSKSGKLVEIERKDLQKMVLKVNIFDSQRKYFGPMKSKKVTMSDELAADLIGKSEYGSHRTSISIMQLFSR